MERPQVNLVLFKYIWRLIERIDRDLAENRQNTVDGLANISTRPNRPAFTQDLENICAQTGDTLNLGMVAPLQNIILTSLRAATDLAIEDDNEFRQTLVQMITEKIGQNKQFTPSRTVMNEYFTDKRDTYYSLMRTWHYNLAIADVLIGRYEDLDPIIGDQACEMRCPFLLDAIAAIHVTAAQPDFDINALKEIALGLSNAALTYPNDHMIEINTKSLATFVTAIPADFLRFSAACRPPLDALGAVTQEEFTGPDVVYPNIAYSVTTIKNNVADVVENLIDDAICPQYNPKPLALVKPDTAPAHAFSGAEYLRLCKSFTRNREALMDELGVDIDHESTLTYFDAYIKQNKRGYVIKPLNNEAADWEKQLLAHCSTSYMKATARMLSAAAPDQHIFPQITSVFNTVQANINRSGYMINLMPVFEAFRVLLAHAVKNRHPIVVNLNRMQAIDNENFKFLKQWVLYYEPNEDGKFTYIAEPSEEQKARPAIAVVAASVVNEDRLRQVENIEGAAFINEPDCDAFFEGLLQCDIAQLLMLFAANHPIFPASATVPNLNIIPQQVLDYRQKKPGKTIPPKVVWEATADAGRSYMRQNIYVETLGAAAEPAKDFALSLLRPPQINADDPQALVKEYDYYIRLTEALGIEVEGIKYALMQGARNLQEDTTWVRNPETLPFTPTHMYVSSFAAEQRHQHLDALIPESYCESLIQKSFMRCKSVQYHWNLND